MGLFASLFLTGIISLAPPTERPNLVVIFCDDMGWGDAPGFALEGAKIPEYAKLMPHIERLAREGARFTNFYSAQPVCSASRAALLTGCYPNRIGIHGALFPDSKVGIAAEERTIAEMLHDAGYATGIFGKWHLGHQPQFNPLHHGFDEFFGIPYSNDMWPPRQGDASPLLPLFDGEDVVERLATLDDQSSLTKRITERAVKFIRSEAQESQPFFAYIAQPQPHTPLAVSRDRAPESRDALYGAVMREIDWSVGEVLRALDETGVAANTIVMFASDNGPWLAFGSDAGTTGGLREGKGTTFEGGVRVPCIIRWSGHVPLGCVSSVPWMTIDLLPTIGAIVGASPPAANRPIDGRDASAIWKCDATASSTHDAFYFYYHTNALEAVRMGKWKLVLPHRSRTVASQPRANSWNEAKYVDVDIPLALYDLESDPAETTDVQATNANVVTAIMKQVEAARADLGDSLTKRDGNGRRSAGRVNPPAEKQSAIAKVAPPSPTLAARLELSPKYTKCVMVDDFPIVASASVSDQALYEAAYLIRMSIGSRPEILKALAANRVRFVVMAPTEMTTDVPEHSDLTPRSYWDRRARGLGATAARPAVSCGEENLLCLRGDPYSTENILLHEFPHAVHEMGLNTIDPTFDTRLQSAYDAARDAGLWKDTYAMENRMEYWAEGAQSWFDTNRSNDNQHGPIDTREKLKAYDPRLAALLTEVFGDGAWRYVRPDRRSAAPETDPSRAHLVGFDAASRDPFVWPEQSRDPNQQRDLMSNSK